MEFEFFDHNRTRKLSRHHATFVQRLDSNLCSYFTRKRILSWVPGYWFSKFSLITLPLLCYRNKAAVAVLAWPIECTWPQQHYLSWECCKGTSTVQHLTTWRYNTTVRIRGFDCSLFRIETTEFVKAGPAKIPEGQPQTVEPPTPLLSLPPELQITEPITGMLHFLVISFTSFQQLPGPLSCTTQHLNRQCRESCLTTKVTSTSALSCLKLYPCSKTLHNSTPSSMILLDLNGWIVLLTGNNSKWSFLRSEQPFVIKAFRWDTV